ncbi:MAG: ABC transporter substrate-binding protein, partial [Spirochaetota bacterium]
MSTILVVDEYVPSQRVVLARNPNYYETDAEGTRPPYVDEVVFQIISDQDTMLQSFIAGNLSFLPLRGEHDAGLEEPQLTWLQNNTFRTAMAHLVDRETIINNIAFGFGSPQYSFVPRMSPYYWDGADEA